jgi:hypothetical protein
MSNNTKGSLSYEMVSEPDPLEALLNEVCIVYANETSFAARLVKIHEKNELWFEAKNGQKIMVSRGAVTGIRPLLRQ